MRRTFTAALAALVMPTVAAGVLPAGASAAPAPSRSSDLHLPAPALIGRPAAATGAPTGAHLAGTAEAAASPARSAAVAPGIVIGGHGFGHGRGMGQYGAYGYASQEHWTAAQIVEHFYGGGYLRTVSTTLDRAPITVNLSELDGVATTTLEAARGATLRIGTETLSGGVPHAVAHTGREQVVTASSGDVSVELPGIGWRSYLGSIALEPTSVDQTWNRVPLEAYLEGVVPSESIPAWGASGGEAALQAQAIAARSYALNYVVGFGRTCDSQSCQVYAGDPATFGLGTYASYTDQAVSSTAGEVVCSGSAPTCAPSQVMSTEYSSSTGGWTAGGTFPAVADAGDTVSPYHDWSQTVPLSTIESLYPQVGRVTMLLVVKRNGYGDWGGRAVEIRVYGTRGSVTDTAVDLENDLGLLSDWFRFVQEPPKP